MATQANTTWHLRGTVVIACNRDYGCPCNVNAMCSRGDCAGGWTWHVAEGHHEGVRLDGLNVSMAADWPDAIREGNGEAMFMVDERADERRRETLRRFLARFTFQPGAEIFLHSHPGTTLLGVESGRFGWTLAAGAAHVVRGASGASPAPAEDLTEPRRASSWAPSSWRPASRC